MPRRPLGMTVLLALTCLILALGTAACESGPSRRSMLVTVTAYNSTRAQTDASPFVGAWGDRLAPGTKAVAVSPDLVEEGLTRGTEVRIQGLEGRYVVLDRTHGRFRRRVDVYMGLDVERAREFGVQKRFIWWGGP